jgi:hypothetical protein
MNIGLDDVLKDPLPVPRPRKEAALQQRGGEKGSEAVITEMRPGQVRCMAAQRCLLLHVVPKGIGRKINENNPVIGPRGQRQTGEAKRVKRENTPLT